jgi:hypothetical protein
MHPMLIILLAILIVPSSSSFGFWLLLSMPMSIITSTARGLIWDVGRVPALVGS